MKPLSDIKNRKDIETLISIFYKELRNDQFLNRFFANTDWSRYIPVMYNFWENVLFYKGNYTGSPMEKHRELHLNEGLTKAHFDRWVFLFDRTVNEYYKGEKAELMKVRARNIASVMQLDILK